MIDKLTKVETRVRQWAQERKIIDEDNWRQMYLQVLKTQTLKLVEEVGELNTAIWQIKHLQTGRRDLEDAIGDCLVVITSLVWAIKPSESLTSLMINAKADNNNNYNDTSLLLSSELGRLSAAVLKNKPLSEAKICLSRIVLFINYIASSYAIDSINAYEAAYNVIKDRKGKTTVDGNFIKEGD